MHYIDQLYRIMFNFLIFQRFYIDFVSSDIDTLTTQGYIVTIEHNLYYYYLGYISSTTFKFDLGVSLFLVIK